MNHDSTYESLDIRCRYLRKRATGLECEIWDRTTTSVYVTSHVADYVCQKCPIGRAQRELGCEDIGGTVSVLEIRASNSPVPLYQMAKCVMFCQSMSRQVDWNTCLGCPRTHRPVVQEALTEVRGLLDRLGFKEAESKLRDALLALQAGLHADAVLKSKTALESCLRSALDGLKASYDPKTDIGGLWQAVKKQPGIWDMASGDATQQISGGVVSIALGVSTIRSRQTDAHGRAETPVTVLSQAELALYCTAALCLFIARRFKEVRGD